MTGTLEYASMGLVPGGAYKNRDYLADKIDFAPGVDTNIRDLLFSPETSGGLLISVPGEKAAAMEEALQQEGCFFAQVGRVISTGFQSIKVLNSNS